MLKSFRQKLREQSIHLHQGNKDTRHSRAHKKEPHVAHSLRTGPTGQYDKPVTEARKSTRMSAAERFKRNLKRRGFDLDAHEKEAQRLAQKTDELIAQHSHLLKKEDIALMNTGAGIAGLPPDQPPVEKRRTPIMSPIQRRKKPK